MMDANSDGVVSGLHEAFSREEDQKYYVQDILRFKHSLIGDILFGDKGVVYCCGNSGMAKNVKEVIMAAISEYFKKDLGFAEGMYEDLLRDKRICVEAWG